MLGLALVGTGAAWKTKPYWMLAVFAVSFIPVGFYTLGVPGPFQWIGVSNTLFLISGLLVILRLSNPRTGSDSKDSIPGV